VSTSTTTSPVRPRAWTSPSRPPTATDDELGEFFAPLAEQIKADHALLERLVAGVTSAPQDPPAPPAHADTLLSLDIDLPGLAAGFGHRLHDADMPITVAQAELFVRSLQLMHPGSRRELYFATRRSSSPTTRTCRRSTACSRRSSARTRSRPRPGSRRLRTATRCSR